MTETLHYAVARIPGFVEPIDRGERYADPLDDALQESGLGEVTGGGSVLDDQFVILAADVELSLANLDSAIKLCIETLEKCGAPKGSEIIYGDEPDETRIPFGTTEGVALVLDAATLPEEVYEKWGIDEVIEALRPHLEGAGEFHGCRALDETSELYYYGASADRLIEILESIRGSFAFCVNSSIRKIEL